MDVTQRHPSYTAFASKWRQMRDALDIEAIKDAGTRYLPMPGGMKDEGENWAENPAYIAYKKRAQYPDIVAPAIRAMAGVIHREPATIELPDSLEYLRERATKDGLTLEALHRRITRELLTTGRLGLMVDTEEGGGEPYIALYRAEDVANWHEVDGGVDLVVLDESGDEMDRETLVWRQVERHRVLALDEGYTVTVVTDGQVEEYTPAARGGQGIDAIPFVFVDTNDLTAEPDEVPLYGMATTAVSIYGNSADMEQALFMVGQPQRWCSGVEPEDVPDVWGSSHVWVLPPPDAKAGMLEFEGAGIAAQRQNIADKLKQAAQYGARLFEAETSQAESGEAKKIRHGAQTATLATIAKTGAAGLERALRWCAEFSGANPADVSVSIDTDFIDQTLGAQEMTAIANNAMAGLISKQTHYELLQAGGRANTERDWEAEQALIEQDGPDLGTLNDEPE